MDIQPQSTQPISDDQELAKVLAGVTAEGDDEETTGAAMSDIVAPVAAGPPPAATPVVDSSTLPAEPQLPPVSAPLPAPSLPTVGGDDLGSVKSDAINELRPLVDKLNLAPEEKFDTYLLLIRSTDDKSLVAPAHEAAKQITDEARKAQALLDIIKEIDFLSNPQQQQ
ncbi:hypothetical protein IPM09_04585 [Candidatus Saccharibacteria bacterium]|nr:MAG: hypothetical protein IPM09_04585 [Candidatus Saccharibacteria bacterium]